MDVLGIRSWRHKSWVEILASYHQNRAPPLSLIIIVQSCWFLPLSWFCNLSFILAFISVIESVWVTSSYAKTSQIEYHRWCVTWKMWLLKLSTNNSKLFRRGSDGNVVFCSTSSNQNRTASLYPADGDYVAVLLGVVLSGSVLLQKEVDDIVFVRKYPSVLEFLSGAKRTQPRFHELFGGAQKNMWTRLASFVVVAGNISAMSSKRKEKGDNRYGIFDLKRCCSIFTLNLLLNLCTYRGTTLL